MQKYDVIIVGGGVAGLYAAYKFLQQTHSEKSELKILLIEKDSKLGGRIQTKYNQGVGDSKLQYDIGPARISTNHKIALKLIDSFKLAKSKIQPFKKHRHVQADGSVIVEKDKSFEYIHKIITKSKTYSSEYLQSITFKVLADKILGLEDSMKLQDMFGYDAEFKYCNAYDSLRMFRRDFQDVGNYYSLKDGLAGLIQALSDYIKNSNNVKILKNKKIVKFEYDDFKKVATIFSDDGKGHRQMYQCDKLIWAIPQKQLVEIEGWTANQKSLLNRSVTPVSLHRIFCQFPLDPNKGTTWISEIARTTTNDAIRQFIPMAPKLGFAQVSYSDSHYADYWNNYATKTKSRSKTALIRELLVHFKKVFPEINNIEKPIFIDNKYWPEGVHMWKPGVNSDDIYSRILYIGASYLDEHKLQPIYIIGETYSRHQCWIEGALETVEDLFRIL